MRPEERSSAVGRVRDQFPVGMRVLAVDDDPVCLKVLETLLRRCQYHVTTTNQAVVALKMLRENREMFDLVISDVHMPDMDGFKLLELVGLEMDLPVIMLSVNGETKTVMKGITHGACDYLLKPVRIEELRNIWQHVVRRKFSSRDRANIDAYEECNKPPNADFDHVHSQITCGSPDSGRPSKKRKEYHSEEEDDEGDESNGQENDDPSAPKKPRVVWSVELHRKFVAAVNHLGIDKAVPKRILELMNVEKLTRENKYRLYLKRLSAVASQQAGIVAALGGSDAFMRMGAFEGLQGYQTFTSSATLPSFSSQGLLSNQPSFGIQGMAASRSIQIANSNSTVSHSIRDANKYHLSLPGNQRGNLAQGLTTSVGQVQLPQKWINEETNDLSAILSTNGLANHAPSTLQSVTNSPLLQQELVECREANAVIQPSIRTSSGSSEHLGSTIGVSSSLMDSRISQQSCLPLSAYSASGLPMNGSFGNNVGKLGATSSGGTHICSSNDLTVARENKVGAASFCSTVLLPPGGDQNAKYLSFGNASSLRQSMDGMNADNLLDSKQVWGSLLSNSGAHHSVTQRSNSGGLGARMIGQASASASTAAPQTKFDMFISGGDILTPKNASDFSIPKLHSELSSSSCSFDGLLNSIIKVSEITCRRRMKLPSATTWAATSIPSVPAYEKALWHIPASLCTRVHFALAHAMATAARRARFVGVLLFASRRNPKPLSSSSSFSSTSAAPASSCDHEGDRLSRRLLRLRLPRGGAAAAAVEKWAQERGHVSQPELRHAIAQLRRARRYEHALEVFSWVDTCNSLELSSWDHAARLDLIAKAHGTSQAEEYYNKLQSAAAKRAASFPLLHCYVMEKNIQKAETFMAELQRCGLPVDPHSFNEMMKLYVATCQYEKVLSVINLMKRNNIPRNVLSYNIWMNASAQVSGVASVQSVFQEMVNDDKVEVGWSTYCTLANIFRMHGMNTEAQAYLRKAETKLSSTGRLGYSFIMTCYAALNDSEGIIRMWEASKNVPGRIPAANYMSVILCLIKIGDISRAEWIFGSWEAECRKHDVRVSNVLLGAYVRNGWIEKAERLHLHMLEKGARPNYKTWEILMEGYVQSRQMDKAVGAMKKCLSLLKGCHWRPPVELIEAIAKHFEEKCSADDAYRYIKVLQKLNLTTLDLYKSLLRAYINAEAVPPNIPEMLARDQIVVDEETAQLIIRAGKIDITGDG
ncbi:hypothetical protein EJB05_19395 [Eragrostis curvula]|uniref:Response regulatory domain-containing protein n=1 Tax=Eragrostis curvula TaxID=38414 RepID=A0A5J9UX74_9POAL|nr:hypothetical protein EJB05_19395 [Eragrostis curvula]